MNDDHYTRAVELMVRDQIASTSYLQRKLAIGYNAAARLIERAEEEGIIGRPNLVGKREVLKKPDLPGDLGVI